MALDEMELVRIEQIKAFFRKWGATLISGVILIIAAVMGYAYYESYQKNQKKRALNAYTLMITAHENGQQKNVKSQA